MCSRTGGFLTGKLMIITHQSFLSFESRKRVVCQVEITVV